MIEVEVQPDPPDRFRDVLSGEQYAEFQAAGRQAARRLRGVTVWHVNSTARGGGVAEMLRSLLGYAAAGGLDVRWLVLRGGPEFFDVTKRIHNRLHGSAGDGGDLGPDAQAVYRGSLAPAATDLAGRVAPGDVVVLHDPQTAGLVPDVRRLGAIAVWRCHVGTDLSNELTEQAWNFLLPHLADVDATVFSRRQFAWSGLDPDRVHVIAPSIDAFSPKNRDLSEGAVWSILSSSGVVPAAPTLEGTPALSTRATMVEDLPVPTGAPVVAQVSRWDRLKDPVGVIEGFAAHVVRASDAHLLVAGPGIDSVADDPEGAEVLDQCVEARAGLPAEARPRVHLACLPMNDPDENALMVNAVQHHAEVVVQKSLAEGFGLTVAEAMWKARPVVASRVGGIQDQVEHGRTGLLVADPEDLAEFGEEVRVLLEQRDRAAAMGHAARETVRDHYLAPRHLRQYAELLEELVESRPS
ncbi:MAG TPA: glycosyltransferase [Terriglobales bacterium]|nr:glycosyltransferase [Terriglobales bacterium]